MAAKFQQLQELFPDANVVSMVESDATVLLYDYTSVSVKVIMRARPKRRHDAVVCLLLAAHLSVVYLWCWCRG